MATPVRRRPTDLNQGEPRARGARAPSPLVDLIAGLRREPCRFRFVQALRLLALAGDRGAPTHRPVRFRTPASLAFPASEVLGLAEHGDRLELTVGFLGLTGPSGVLPAHYTELLMERRDRHRDGAAHAFLDLFSHRALELFLAAWRKHRCHLARERGEPDGITGPLLTLAGLVPDRDGADPALACLAGALVTRPLPATLLTALLEARFGVPMALEPFVGQWLEVPGPARARLGAGAGPLGAGACLGARAWDRQTRIQLRVGPLSLAALGEYLPDGPGGRALAGFVRTCLGHALACDLVLVLAAGCARPPVLASPRPPRLGFDLRLASRLPQGDLDDLRCRLVA
jgi:type VI secretion system protein ImpH